MHECDHCEPVLTTCLLYLLIHIHITDLIRRSGACLMNDAGSNVIARPPRQNGEWIR